MKLWRHVILLVLVIEVYKHASQRHVQQWCLHDTEVPRASNSCSDALVRVKNFDT